MAMKSFYEDLILDTPEAATYMEKAFERYERGRIQGEEPARALR